MKLYLVVRGDLPAGAQVAQSCHALRAFAHVYPELEARWFASSNNLVVLSVADEEALSRLEESLGAAGIECVNFREPDFNSEVTALAAGPAACRQVSSLPLALRDRSKVAVEPSFPSCS